MPEHQEQRHNPDLEREEHFRQEVITKAKCFIAACAALIDSKQAGHYGGAGSFTARHQESLAQVELMLAVHNLYTVEKTLASPSQPPA